jgi:hypothetical protein
VINLKLMNWVWRYWTPWFVSHEPQQKSPAKLKVSQGKGFVWYILLVVKTRFLITYHYLELSRLCNGLQFDIYKGKVIFIQGKAD